MKRLAAAVLALLALLSCNTLTRGLAPAPTCVYAGDLTRGLIILAMKPPPFPLP
jgi:hypothetical protein